tara:strand:- start:477 stop:1013 length:537 start_codon:yes stop_codon:yes gene_type:complete
LDNQHREIDDYDHDHDSEDTFAGHQVDESNFKSLYLSPVELLSIDDGLSLLVNKNEFDGAVTLRPVYPSAGIGCSIDLITKVGQAILKMSENLEAPKSQILEITDVDIYVLRELVISQVVKMDKSIALGLRLKLYNLLYSDFVKAEALDKSVEHLLKISDKDGQLGTLLDALKADPEN